MGTSMPAQIAKTVKSLLTYQPADSGKRFVLMEDNKSETAQGVFGLRPLQMALARLQALLEYGQRLVEDLGDLQQKLRRTVPAGLPVFVTAAQARYDLLQQQYKELEPVLLAYWQGEGAGEKRPISCSLAENRRYLARLYHLPRNKDVVLRQLALPGEPSRAALLVFMDGLADKNSINLAVLQPLLFFKPPALGKGPPSVEQLAAQDLPSGQITIIKDFLQVKQAVNNGDAVLFLEGRQEAVQIETKGFEHRGVDRPATEQSVRGSQHSFTEVLRVNTALIRSLVRTADLVTEIIVIGKRGNTNCALMYVDSIANRRLIAEIRRRLRGIDTDSVIDSGLLENYIVDSPQNPFPQTLSTERPDRAAVHLLEGRAVILVDGSPFAQILPVTLFILMHAADDSALNFRYVNVLRIIRWLGGFISMLLPAAYLAVSTFHQEAIPTDLLLSIAAARIQVPFPTLVEILLMEIAFELIREGGLRIPGILGSTIGIVGAIILGQAAVTAKIVSAIMVIVIAVTGLAAYGIPDYRLAAAFRYFRLMFIILAAFMGLVGISCGFLVLLGIVCSLKSFGLPYLAPIAPKVISDGDVVRRQTVYQQRLRPDELNTQDEIRQGRPVRRWAEAPPAGRKKI